MFLMDLTSYATIHNNYNATDICFANVLGKTYIRVSKVPEDFVY